MPGLWPWEARPGGRRPNAMKCTIEPSLGGAGSEVLAVGGAGEVLADQPGQVQQCASARLFTQVGR